MEFALHAGQLRDVLRVFSLCAYARVRYHDVLRTCLLCTFVHSRATMRLCAGACPLCAYVRVRC